MMARTAVGPWWVAADRPAVARSRRSANRASSTSTSKRQPATTTSTGVLPRAAGRPVPGRMTGRSPGGTSVRTGVSARVDLRDDGSRGRFCRAEAGHAGHRSTASSRAAAPQPSSGGSCGSSRRRPGRTWVGRHRWPSRAHLTWSRACHWRRHERLPPRRQPRTWPARRRHPTRRRPSRSTAPLPGTRRAGRRTGGTAGSSGCRPPRSRRGRGAAGRLRQTGRRRGP